MGVELSGLGEECGAGDGGEGVCWRGGGEGGDQVAEGGHSGRCGAVAVRGRLIHGWLDAKGEGRIGCLAGI